MPANPWQEQSAQDYHDQVLDAEQVEPDETEHDCSDDPCDQHNPHSGRHPW